MEVTKTNIQGVIFIKPRLFKDSRGYFFESRPPFTQNKLVRCVKGAVLDLAVELIEDNYRQFFCPCGFSMIL